MGASATTQTFGMKLSAELERQDVGLRTLARRLERREGKTPEANLSRVESIRRSLNLYVHKGRTPTNAFRYEIEAELGLDRDALKPDEDDEARSPMRLVVPVTVEISDDQIERALDRALAARAARFAELEVAS